MWKKISIPVLWETEIEDFIPKIKEFWEAAKMLKQHYPSVWKSIESQYNLWMSFHSGKISEELFEKKVEVMILQDEERRKK